MTSREQTPLERELAESKLDQHELKLIVYRTNEALEEVKSIREEYYSFEKNTPEIFDMNRQEQYRVALKNYVNVRKWGRMDLYNRNFSNYCLYGTNFLFPSGIHWFMSNPMLQLLASESQLAKIAPLIQGNHMIVAYAQTELGHGSDIQSVETTATFEPETQEFVLHSPTISSIKYWPGEMGILANYAIVMANLITKGVDQGVHPFLIRIRDQENHRPMKDLEVGDIGPKMGYNTKDNGFLRLHHYRAPLNSLLNRFYEVKPDGTYTKKGDEKVLYSGMMFVRGLLIFTSYRFLIGAVQIAARYSIIRKQFKDEEGKERPIIDYQLQQAKLLPQIANVLVMRFADLAINNLYAKHEGLMKKNDFSQLGELHAVLSGCKAMFTAWSYFGMEVARLSCGGHGYSHYSGIPMMILDFAPNVTLEGDNTILLLQVARYLLKSVERVMKGKEPGESAEYFKRASELDGYVCSAGSPKDFMDLELLDKVLAAVSIHASKTAGMKLMADTQSIGNLREAWDTKSGLKLREAAKIHVVYYCFQCSVKELRSFVKNAENQKAISHFIQLFVVNQILFYTSLFAESGVLTPAQIPFVRKAYEKLLVLLRPHMIPFVEMFLLDSRTLVSAIAHENCKPYDNLYKWAKDYSILNRIDMTDVVKRNFPQPKM